VRRRTIFSSLLLAFFLVSCSFTSALPQIIREAVAETRRPRQSETKSERTHLTDFTPTPRKLFGADETPVPIPTQTATPGLPDPAEFIQYYYTNIADQNYDLTWSLLSEDFISRNNSSAQGGYEAYVKWWQKVSRVEVESVKILTQQSDTVTVQVDAVFYYASGSQSTEHLKYQLIFDAARGTWLFN
jgi:hypothetical protein